MTKVLVLLFNRLFIVLKLTLLCTNKILFNCLLFLHYLFFIILIIFNKDGNIFIIFFAIIFNYIFKGWIIIHMSKLLFFNWFIFIIKIWNFSNILCIIFKVFIVLIVVENFVKQLFLFLLIIYNISMFFINLYISIINHIL